MSANLARYEHELQRNPVLVERILRNVSPLPADPELVIVRVRHADVDGGICRAIALAVNGVLARVELIPDES